MTGDDGSIDCAQNVPSFHDGHMVGLQVSPRAEAFLFIVDAAGAPYTVALRDVDSMVANDFRKGNIILSLEVGLVGESNAREIRELYCLVSDAQIAQFERQTIARLEQLHSQLVELTPSYGCSLLATCKSVAVMRGHVSGLEDQSRDEPHRASDGS